MNHWDGTNESLPAFVSRMLGFFGVSGKVIDIQDLKTMHVVINLGPEKTPRVVYELLSRRIIDVVAAGVALKITDDLPWFSLDFDTESVQGLDDGYWIPLS